MDEQQHQRLAELQLAECGSELICRFYGVDLQADKELGAAYAFWLERRGLSQTAGDRVNRHRLELFFQTNDVMPRKLAAVRLGMTLGSLDDVLTALERHNWEPYRLRSRAVVAASLKDALLAVFNFRIRAANHSDFCFQLHDAIEKATGIAIQPATCVTSEALHEDPVKFAYDFDCITDEAISLAYRVWLDLHKPISLPPDCCSLLFYVQNQHDISAFLAGGIVPEIPAQLAAAV